MYFFCIKTTLFKILYSFIIFVCSSHYCLLFRTFVYTRSLLTFLSHSLLAPRISFYYKSIFTYKQETWWCYLSTLLATNEKPAHRQPHTTGQGKLFNVVSYSILKGHKHGDRTSYLCITYMSGTTKLSPHEHYLKLFVKWQS